MRRVLPACLLGAALLGSMYWALGGVRLAARVRRWGPPPSEPAVVKPEVLPVALEAPAIDPYADNSSVPFGMEARQRARPAARPADATFPTPREPAASPRRPALRLARKRMRFMLHRSFANDAFVPSAGFDGGSAASGDQEEAAQPAAQPAEAPEAEAPNPPAPSAAPAPRPARVFQSVTTSGGSPQGGGPAYNPQAPQYGSRPADDGGSGDGSDADQ